MPTQSTTCAGSKPGTHSRPGDQFWPFWFLVPLYPYQRRQTLRREIVPDRIWVFEQLQGILYTITPIRMTVVRLEAGGLLVYAPVAPTRECVRLVNDLVMQYGAVKYILLPTSSGLEHKVFAGPFARQFSTAQVFVAPHQWSFPFDLPLPWLGFPPSRTFPLPEQSQQTPFGNEFDYEVLDINLGRGSFVEVALYHRRTHTLLVTDSVLSVSADPPAIAQLDPYPLLFHARDSAAEAIVDTPDQRCKGWQRIALFAIYFRPGALQTLGLGETLRGAIRAGDRSPKAYFGLFPFQWQETWQQAFATLSGHGRPFVAPILQTLILPQAPRTVLTWVQRVARWDVERIIPCHFDAPISASSHHFRQAFAFLDGSITPNRSTLPDEDTQFIRQIEATLLKRGIATPPRESS